MAYTVRVCNFFRSVVVFISSIPAGRRVLKAWCKTCIVFALCSVNRRIESTRAKVNRHVKVINTVFERYVKLPVLFTASLCSIPAYKADFYDVNCSEVVLTSKTKLAANPYQYLYSPISWNGDPTREQRYTWVSPECNAPMHGNHTTPHKEQLNTPILSLSTYFGQSSRKPLQNYHLVLNLPCDKTQAQWSLPKLLNTLNLREAPSHFRDVTLFPYPKARKQ